MHVRVVELMVAGVRRPREECLADPGTIGTLSIGDIPIGTAEKRPLHAAQLWERWGTSARRGLLPLRIPAKLNSHSGQREHPDP